MLTKVSISQLSIYNTYAWLFRPFIAQITEEKDVCDIPTWNGIFISQYMTVKTALDGRFGFSDKCNIIMLIANINFDKPNISCELMNHLDNLTNKIEENPAAFGINLEERHNYSLEESPLILTTD